MGGGTDERTPKGFDTSVPNSARVWNYWLGGKDGYPVDREAGEQYRQVYPAIVDVARAGRRFLARSVRYLAGAAGVRQFLDVGTGLPTLQNTHEIAQSVAPECRVVYVDNDPLVLTHARALLASSPEGATDYVDADMHQPGEILRGAAAVLDFSRPVGLMLIGVLGHVQEYEDARSIVKQLLDGLVPGSHLVLADSVSVSAAHRKANARYRETGAVPYLLRSEEEIRGFFDGVELVDPGFVPVTRWRCGRDPAAAEIGMLGGVGLKTR
ncbi:SAM-dependent methyltransferase [Actinomadura chibensis]|uniref:SAM-dependent methyltransferase n=1 Tax=Actinomadura chibensis TaxID=392828 RepID=A0A5D0NK95_9ACTN|nr:SAM-dependent methyltransferase [Actinomadura chibensis]TYB44867.1 SAM-dependent methyltransferase [Actinomadura chibensis]